MIADRTEPVPATPRRWSLVDDYLADPAVAPMRALLAALVRRMHRSRHGAPAARECPPPAGPARPPLP
jgi:hypothetical protein